MRKKVPQERWSPVREKTNASKYQPFIDITMKFPSNIVPASLIPLLLVAFAAMAPAESARAQVLVPSGTFHSVMPEVKGEPIAVDSFYLDTTAVTNKQFAAFLKEQPEWHPAEIPAIFADKGYLGHWPDSGSTADIQPDQPLTNVSWFAANAYCKWIGGRLPSLNEWEYSAQLMEFEDNAAIEAFNSRLMRWYSSVDTKNLAAVGSTGIENRYGVKDQFGLIMEWVEDFNPPLADDLSLDCGTIGRMQQLGNTYSYAASIRYITRMSFNPQSTPGTMGFRCAYDMEFITAQEAEQQ